MPSTTRSTRSRAGHTGALVAIASTALVLSACSTDADPDPERPQGASPFHSASGSASLQSFDNCDSLLDYHQSNARDQVGPWGFEREYYWGDVDDAATEESADSDGGAAAADSAGDDSGSSYSGTNNQEAGVDEADVVKTDGEIIITATGETVTLVDLADGTTLDLPLPRIESSSHELLLHGDTLVVLSQEYTEWAYGPQGGDSDTYPAFSPQRTVVSTIDLTNRETPELVGSVRMEGGYRSARLIDGTVRMAMVSSPTGVQVTSPDSYSLFAESRAADRNRELIDETEIDDWIPHVQTIDSDGTAGEPTQLLDCNEIAAPEEFSGFSTVSVLTFDAGDPSSFAPTSGAGVVGDGSTVYASTDALIVATSPWSVWMWDGEGSMPQASTDLHLFDISEPEATNYSASGRIDGRLLNQFALSETGGVIRAATTLDATREEDSQSSLIMLAEEDGALVETGRLDGLGLDERIYAVRYLSPDLASVVTFREVDPLYLIDTSDPTSPELLGELKIPGYSAYLHPINDQYLLGVGQDADEETGWTEGTQVSLFDISDLTNPQRVSQLGWDGGYSPVEYDHRAFTYWPETGQVYLPLETYIWDESDDGDGGTEEHWAGVVSVDVDADAGEVTETGRTEQESGSSEWPSVPMRTIVVGDDLWVINYDTIVRHDLETLAEEETIRIG